MMIVEHVAGTQILLRGQVTDALTGAGIAARLTLTFDQGAGPRPLPFGLRHQTGGYFAVAARMTEIVARMRLGQAVTLGLTAEAEGYQTASLSRALTAAEFARKDSVLQVGGQAVPTQSVAAAPIVMALTLKPNPVMLAGIVLSANQLTDPVPGAKVKITGPGGSETTSGPDGRFRFDAPPLALSLSLTATLGPRTASALHLTEFTTPVNFITLSLPPP